MKKITVAFSTAAVLITSSPSFAELQVRFVEGAPKDRFVITNIGECDLSAGQVKIDFARSSGNLIFDVTGSGAGVEVFQPFEVTTGAQLLMTQPSISDGDQVAMLDISGLGVEETIAFTIDVDDTKGMREITVSNGEISGTIVSLISGSNTYSAVMTAQAQAVLSTPSCGI
ncbi:MAG: aggregation factor core [Roseobacter sp.]